MTAAAAVSSSKGPADPATAIGGHAWEDTGGQQSWETAVQEDGEGNIVVAGGESIAEKIRRRRKRMEQNDYSQKSRRVVRDMIRYLYVMIDASRWVRQKDPVLPPGTQIEAVIKLLQDFIQDYYDQNPLSHLGFVVARNGEAEILSPLSSSSKAHKLALTSLAEAVLSSGPSKGGEFSLQNGLEVAGRSLGHQPRHGSREIVLICGALSTCDPGYVLTETLPRLKAAHIRFSAIALSAEMHVCRKIAEETGGVMGVTMDQSHLRDWLRGQSIPPPVLHHQQDLKCEFLSMGFPTRIKSDIPTLIHATREKKLLATTAYTCPQCQAKIAELPTDCVVCGLKLVLAPHLARSFHHLFPVAPFREVLSEEAVAASQDSAVASSSSDPSSLSSARRRMGKAMQPRRVVLNHKLLITSNDTGKSCFACMRQIGVADDEGAESLRFQCPDCKNIFCVDCDAYLHESLHNCPGCLRMH